MLYTVLLGQLCITWLVNMGFIIWIVFEADIIRTD